MSDKPSTTGALTLTTPTQGTLVTGINAQGTASGNIEKVTALKYKDRCQRTTRRLVDEKKKATAAVADAEAAYAAAVERIVPPGDFVADLIALTAAAVPFYADAVATTYDGVPFAAATRRRGKKKPAAAQPDAAAVEPDAAEADDDVRPTANVINATQYQVVGQVRTVGRKLLDLTRTYPLPADVLVAAAVVAEAKAAVSTLDASLVEVRNELARAGEVGDLAAAAFFISQMQATQEGRALLDQAETMVDRLGDAAGLDAAPAMTSPRPPALAPPAAE